ncbi:MAG: PHP domain-containing protein [Ignavibacteria bacterium]
MIIDFHTHTYNSYDSMMKPEKIIAIARARGLTGIVINDHGTIKGGLECESANKDKNFKIIVGAEIATDVGDITGIFLKEEIRSRKFSEVIEEIKRQGGYTIINHPYVKHKLDEINFDGIDMVEGFNSRVDWEKNILAIELAIKYNKPVIAGSDAHLYSEIANCKTLYDQDSDILNPSGLEYTRNNFTANIFSQFIKSYKRKDLDLGFRTALGTPRKIIRRMNEDKKKFIGKVDDLKNKH